MIELVIKAAIFHHLILRMFEIYRIIETMINRAGEQVEMMLKSFLTTISLSRVVCARILW